MRRIAAALLTGMLVVPGYALADYLAYTVLSEGEKIPLPQNLEKIDAEHLVRLEWGAFEGRRARAGVLPVENRSSASVYSVATPNQTYDIQTSMERIPVDGIEAIVTDVMNRTGRFRLVERAALESVLGEQDLAASGRVAKPSGAATGKVLGAEYLVQVVVTDYETDVSGDATGGLAGGILGDKVPVLGGIKVKKSFGRVGLNVRLIDAETSEVMYTNQVESIIKESGFDLGGIGFGGGAVLGGFMSDYAKTPIGAAVIAGINKGVYDLVQQVGAQPATGSVVKADAGKIWLNLGSDSVSVGERLSLKRKGEELIDPETGISLGSSDTTLGDIEVQQVQEKFSIARSVSLSGEAARGDVVVSYESPTPLEFADSWTKPKKKR